MLVTLACQAVLRAWQPFVAPSPTPPPLYTIQTQAPAASDTPSPAPTLTPTRTPRPPSPTAPPTLTSTETSRPTASPLQLRVFEELWQDVDENYLYPDFNGLDWNAIHREYRQQIEAGLSAEDFYLAMEEMISRLGDDHSAFLSPAEGEAEDAQLAGEGEYVGIGVLTVPIQARHKAAIILVYPGSPADDAGLASHDSILAVDGQPVLDENGLRRDLLQGPEGTSLILTIQTPGQAPRQVKLTRRRIQETTPVPYSLLVTPAGKRIGYILLVTFNDSQVDDKVGDALRALSADGPLDGLILDDRQNPGGVNTVLRDTLAYFTSGVLGHFVNRQENSPLRVIGKNIKGSQKVPLVVLVGRDTVSFGEIFAGILQDTKRAFLIGEQTDGNVEILWVYDLPDGSRAWIAHDVFQPLNHPDQDWEQNGILPDLTAASSWDEVTQATDPAILASLAHFDDQ